jgi:hypothetical protein
MAISENIMLTVHATVSSHFINCTRIEQMLNIIAKNISCVEDIQTDLAEVCTRVMELLKHFDFSFKIKRNFYLTSPCVCYVVLTDFRKLIRSSL